ncbi:RING-type E3 ubiquitin transferase [Trifolium repens]|nr:E3 ubiquitin-protein ligase SINA [Trifolium repens]WJX52650.1 RING-type E3 ubiquitin transferase [Trifolium repens]
MVTFSVGGSDDGEGPSNPNQKRRRVHDEEQPAYNTEDEENQLSYESQEGFEMENSPFGTLENDAIEGTSSGSNSRQANDMCKTVSAVISDPDVLDCFICSEPLSIPIFQCENGHIACSKCCGELRNKCPMCLMPIGYNRCRTVEKLLESIKISCPNANYGCKKMFSCNMKSSHEKECLYTPFKCPHAGCGFLASSKELALHFSHRHAGSGIQFRYGKYISVSMNTRQKEIVLIDQNDATLFIVHNNLKELGNVVYISCLCPKAMASFDYVVKARSHATKLKLQTTVNTIQDNNGGAPTTGFLLIPSGYFGFGQLKLDIRIKSH